MSGYKQHVERLRHTLAQPHKLRRSATLRTTFTALIRLAQPLHSNAHNTSPWAAAESRSAASQGKQWIAMLQAHLRNALWYRSRLGMGNSAFDKAERFSGQTSCFAVKKARQRIVALLPMWRKQRVKSACAHMREPCLGERECQCDDRDSASLPWRSYLGNLHHHLHGDHPPPFHHSGEQRYDLHRVIPHAVTSAIFALESLKQ